MPWRQPIETNPKNLVNDSVITQAQADKVLAFFNEKAKKHQADCAKMNNMPPEKCHAFMDQNRKAAPDLLRDLAKKALSQDQAKAVVDALRPPMSPGMQPPPPPPNHQLNIEANIKKLINDNVITQVQADKVLAFLKDKSKDAQANRDKMRTMTSEERQAFMDQKRKDAADTLRELAKQANLTEAQAKAVANALRPPMSPGMQHPPPPDAPPSN